MQPYPTWQNYLTPYNQYQNPYYQNPYARQANQPVQNYIQKIVDGIDAVKATDIPMDGSAYYFPKADGTEIFAKKWNPDGSTTITSYLPLESSQNDSTIKSSSKSFQEQMEAINTYSLHISDQVDALVSMLEKNTKGNVKKKEVNADEC